MTEILLNKVFFLIFFLCVLNVGNHIWGVIKKLRGEGYKEKYEVSRLELLLLGLSIAFLLSTIFVGIKI